MNRQRHPHSAKSIFLAVLMVTMSLSAGIVEINRAPWLETEDVAAVGAGCASITRASGEAIYVDPVNGSDAWEGTWSCPKATLSDALNESSSNDEIVLYSGQYHENVTVDNKDNLLIRAADSARVVFDGTQSIAEDMDVTWTTADSDGIQEVTLPVDGWQLFLAYDEQVPARWPNAQFSDETVFNRSYWAEGTLTGSNNAYTVGWLTDAGPETGVHTGLNETINATGLDPEGAIAVMNLGSFRTTSRVITDWNSANGTFAYDGNGVGWKTKHHAYFLEGKRELIDVDGEWWFNNANNRLHYKTPSGQDANNLDLRVKVQPFAIGVENSDGVTIQGIDFFGTTVNFNECDGCSFTNSTLEYPSTSKRGLGIAGESEDDRWMIRFYRSTNSFVDNISITNTGGAVPTWEIHPSLPSGLNFGSGNGSIWGTPTGLLENVTYTVYANNSGGSPSTTFTLGLNWTLTPSAEGAFITRNSSIASDITWEWDYDPLEAQNLSLVTGEWNTCALDSNQNVFCWGRNGNGQIGNGQTGTAACGTSGHNCKDIPTATNDLGSDVISLAFGHQHACGLLDTGAVKCWGRNNAGQLGTSGGDKDTPQTINLGSGRTATSIYAGGHYTCAILDDASVKCWGQNTDGQLGIGSTSNTNTPTTINTLGSGRTAVSLATAMSTVCALLDDGSVKCWGSDYDGQLGNGGTNADLSSPPSSAINLGTGRTAKAITGGEFHFCAILDDDSIKCWGQGTDGKLGTGSTGDRTTPTSTSGSFASGRYAVAIDAGYDHTCVILDNGDMTCWGSDADGQLGNGASSSSTISSLSSSTISLGTGRTAISLSAGGEHTCAQLDNGQLKCWGNRADGQVGDNGNFNNPSDRTSPSSVSSNNHGGNTYLNTGVMPSSAVTGATCEISPSLPTGLSLTAGTCTITGTPTATATNATYTIWANISGQSFSGQVWLEVGLNIPILSYSPMSYSFINGTTIAELQPINTGGEISGFEISPALPTGLAIGSTNGTIWGTPTAASSQTTYTIWGNNSAGSSSTTISIKVETTPTSLSYDTENMTLTKGLAMTTNTATVGDGTPTSWEISPSLPSGLSFSSATGDISGTPTVLQTTAVTYTVWANNTAGSVNTSLNITINNISPNTVVYSPENMTLNNNTAMTTNTPTAGGGPVTFWAISPALPNGLSFGSTNGSIWGTPTIEQSSTTYTVWANNSGGSSSASINITVGPAAPGPFEYNPEINTLTNNTYVHLEPDFINMTTGNGSSWSTAQTGYQLTRTDWPNEPCLNHTYNGTTYVSYNSKLHGYGIANNTLWLINNTIQDVGCYTYSKWPSGTGYSEGLSQMYGTSLYFIGKDGSDRKLYGYGMENETVWVESTAEPHVWSMLVDDVMYFYGETGNSGYELHGHNLSNGTTWMLDDIYSGSGSITGPVLRQNWPVLVGSTFVFVAVFGNGSTFSRETWAHNISNGTSWRLSIVRDAYPTNAQVIGDVAYFSQQTSSSAFSLYAYNASNATLWMVSGSYGNRGVDVTIDGVLYGSRSSSSLPGGFTLWAHNPNNGTSWEIAPQIAPGINQAFEIAGTLYYMGGVSYSQEVWAYEPTNTTAWKVTDITLPQSGLFFALGDLIYFTGSNATTSGVWAHSTSNHSTWFVSNPFSSNTA
ncbi:MAG: putative Ig domain-containing protein, partial [Candidatus Poseidonia sp.]|nr:putative Ig domain-containing protein [Poseidonia sp.]